jgi:hypothetical protein
MMAFYKSERFETPLNADLDAFRLQQRQWKAARGRRNREPGARLLVGCGKISAREVDECFYEHFMSGMDDGTALRQANLISLRKFSDMLSHCTGPAITSSGDGTTSSFSAKRAKLIRAELVYTASVQRVSGRQVARYPDLPTPADFPITTTVHFD